MEILWTMAEQLIWVAVIQLYPKIYKFPCKLIIISLGVDKAIFFKFNLCLKCLSTNN